MEQKKNSGYCREKNGKLIGKYVYLEKGDEDEFCKLMQSFLDTYRANANFFLTIDLETDGLDYINGNILLFSISWNGKHAVVFSPHFMFGEKPNRETNRCYDLLLQVLEVLPISNQNIKFDAKWWFYQYGILVNVHFDTMVASQLCYAGCWPAMSFALDNIVKYILYPMEISKGQQTSFIGQPVTQESTWDQIHYAANDALVSHRLVEPLTSRLHNNNLYDVWKNIELPLITSLIISEVTGVAVDIEAVKLAYQQSKEDQKGVHETLQKIYQTIPSKIRPVVKDDVFNPNSSAQVVNVLSALGLKVTSSSKDALSNVLLSNPESDIIKGILQYRKIQNGSIKYFKAWLEEHINPKTSCIHPNFKSCHADTGRMASSDPNMQNIPPGLRHLIVAKPGRKIITADYSQFEFRAAGAYTGEQLLIDLYCERAELLPLVKEIAIKHGQPDPDHFVKQVKKGNILVTPGELELVNKFAFTDVHRRNSALVLGIDVSEVTDKTRGLGKAQPLYSKILTPTGFKLMGNIGVGDKVCNPDGSVATVAGVYPQGAKDCYRITFRNGQKVDSCKEHLWNVLTYEKEKLIKKTVDTSWIKENIKRSQKNRHNESNIFIETSEPLYGEKVDLPIDPYLLGCWLGDGNVTLGRDCAITIGDSELLEKIEETIDNGLSLKLSTVYDKRTPSYRITRKNAPGSRKIPSFFERIDNLGLGESKSYSKFVPEIYLNSDVNSRLSILQGLLDTDGTVDKVGNITFSSASKTLSNNVIDLVRSLGGKASTFTKKIKGYRDSFMVYLFLPNNLPPFKLSRKLERVKPKKDRYFRTSVKSVEYIGQQDCQCIMVDNPNHLYITDDYMITHNTLGYALLYGAGPGRMLEQLYGEGFFDITMKDCSYYRDVFMKQLPKVAQFIKETHERVKNPGFIETFAGRKRFFTLPPAYQTRYYEQKLADAQRQAVNAIFQASNADATKMSIVEGTQVFNTKYETDIPVILLNVHDEIVSEAWESNVEEAADLLVKIMIDCGEKSLDRRVPVEVSMSIGDSWTK